MGNRVPVLKKIRITLLCMSVSAGIVYFFDIFRNFTSTKAEQLLWIILFGIAFAYGINYDLTKFSKDKHI